MSGIFSYDANGPASRIHGGTGRMYPDPFLTYSTLLLPRTMEETLRWCESFWHRNGTYARAMMRVIAYFITKVEITDADNNEKEKYEEFLNELLKINQVLYTAGLDYQCYGNAFLSPYIPFKRFLHNKEAGIFTPIDEVEFTYSNGQITWTCPHTNKRLTTSKPVDRKITDESKFRIKSFSPHEIKIKYSPVSGKRTYLWDPPSEVVSRIKKGDKQMIWDTPWEMLQAITKGKMFEFSDDMIFHMREDALSGVKTDGWGLSQLVPNFQQAYYVQMAKMYNEVLMQEYIMPFRVISPPRGPGGQRDPMISSNVGDFNENVLAMLNKHRRNPGGYYSLPFPVEYQALGGEGSQMTTYDHIAAATDDMLNASGVPSELYKGSLQFQALPTALRLFQQSWPTLQAQFNNCLNWVMGVLSRTYNWDKASARLAPVTMADDIERRHILFQLMSAGQVSKGTALAPFGIDASEEMDRVLQEIKDEQEKQEEMQREMEQKALLQETFASGQAAGAAGMMPGGSMGAPGMMQGMGVAGGPAMVTPMDMTAQAQQIAQQLVAMPYEQRRTEMNNLSKANSTLHSLVKGELEKLRNQIRSQGGNQAMLSMQGQPPMM